MDIGTKIKTIDGFEGVVVSNANKSYYGHCPAEMVIVRLPGGVTILALCEIKEQ